MERRLYRSRKNRVVAGVAGGLGEYFDIDPVFVRIIFVLATLASGTGLIAYIILWIVVPHEKIVFPEQKSTAEGDTAMQDKQHEYEYRNRRRRGSAIGGITLIVIGGLFLADNYLPHFSFSDTWPLILVAIGIGLIVNSVRREEEKEDRHENQ
ncbi:MAG TPA: PspC domain-containing protein [Candidatus Kryptonia bacterium]